MSQESNVESDIRLKVTRQAEQFLDRALGLGVDAADVLVSEGSELTAKVRQGKPELVQEASYRTLGLRLFVDHKVSVTYTSDFAEHRLRNFFSHSLELCSVSEPDPLHELPGEEELFQGQAPVLDTWDGEALHLSVKEALAQAYEAERAALHASPLISNSDGATFYRSAGGRALASGQRNKKLFLGATRGTYHSLSVDAMCEDADGKKRTGHEYTAHRYLHQLKSATSIGEKAAEKAVAQRGSGSISTQEMPVIFSAEAVRSLLHTFASVLSGTSVYRQVSFLADRQGQQIASEMITLSDDPLIPRSFGARSFDGEGLAARKNVLIHQGILHDFLLDTYSAKKLGRRSNGCAHRGSAGMPYPSFSNLMLHPGTTPEQSLFDGISKGLYVTELMGFGFNPTTGDFSKGASGVLIEQGRLTRPVSEVTISVPFPDLLQRIDGIGKELDDRSTVICPAIRVSHVTIAGG